MHALRYTEASSRGYSCLIISLNLCPQGLGMWSGERKNREPTFQRQAGKANTPAGSLPGAPLLQLFRVPLCPQLSDLRLVPSEASGKLGLTILTVAYFCTSSNLSQDTTSSGSFLFCFPFWWLKCSCCHWSLRSTLECEVEAKSCRRWNHKTKEKQMPWISRKLPAGSELPTSTFLKFHFFFKLSIRHLKYVTQWYWWCLS